MPKLTTTRLTNRTVKSLKTSQEGGTWVADADLRGFAAKVFPSGAIAFGVRYRTPNGRRKAFVFGRWGEMTPEDARKKAGDLLAAVRRGEDPADSREKDRAMPTVAERVATYLAQVRLQKKRPGEDERYLGLAEERWKHVSLDKLTHDDIPAFRDSLSKTPTQANRAIASVRSFLQDAVRAGLIRSNPAWNVRPYRENPPRARVLTAEEMNSILEALAEEADPHAKAALTMLVETGARVSEVLNARWSDLDFDAGTWRIPSPKAGRPQTLPIAKTTIKMLRALPELGLYIIAGLDPERRRADLKGPWKRALDRSGVRDVTLHDLRRTFGLHVARTAGLHVASKLLRHADIRVTERVYAPLGLDDLREAMEHRADVLPFRKVTEAK